MYAGLTSQAGTPLPSAAPAPAAEAAPATLPASGDALADSAWQAGVLLALGLMLLVLGLASKHRLSLRKKRS